MSNHAFNIRVSAQTRDHRGVLVQNKLYSLIEFSPSGWALICERNEVCHYVDPDNLRDMTASQDL